MSSALEECVARRAAELGVVGAVVGVWHEGRTEYACHGVTSLEHPLPVTPKTLFQFASVGKTYTATAAMVLVERGLLDLDVPVRTYLPDLRLADEDVAARVTTRHLLTHTGGWDGDFDSDTGEGDDALARYVDLMAGLEQVSPLGSRASYSNSGLCLAGRVIEVVSGLTYEAAVKELCLAPLGITEASFFLDDVVTRRFAVGHNQQEDGPPSVVRPYRPGRNGNPAGGLAASVVDQLTWGRFHLGDLDGPLSVAHREAMRTPQVPLRASSMGEAVGISWFLKEIDGVATANHGGTLSGQLSELRLVPERGLVLASSTNSSPNGLQLNQELLRWAMSHYLGLTERDPEPAVLTDEQLAPYVGRYTTGATILDVTAADGGLVVDFSLTPEMQAELGDSAPDYPPFALGMIAGVEDEYVMTDGPAKGLRGYFERDERGRVTVVDFSGRLHTRKVDA